MDPKETVRRGYDAISHLYRGDRDSVGQYGSWAERLAAGIPRHGNVLDLGCGNGVPLARDLAAAGLAVTGVDFSAVQVERARRLVPAATFQQADITAVEFPAASFHAVACLYAIIHLPLVEQPALLARIAGWLRPGGRFLATTGHGAWTGTDDDWLGGRTTMWWSHTDAATYRTWIGDAGLTVEHEEFVPEGDVGHALFWARKPE